MAATAVVSVLAFAILMAVMALGVVVTGRRLRGSCGGNPESANCGCSPAKKAACRAKHAPGETDDDDLDVFSGPALTSETLAPPGERRLVQLHTGRK